MATPTPATLQEFQAYLDKDPGSDDAELQDFLEAATEMAEDWADPKSSNVGPIVAREFTDRVRNYQGRLYLPRTPVQNVTSITRISDGLQHLTAELDVDSKRGTVRLLNGCLLPGDYTVVYDAGRSPVPVSLKEAVLIIAGHLWETQQGPTTNRFVGSENVEDTWRPSGGYLIPNRAAHLLRPHTSILVA